MDVAEAVSERRIGFCEGDEIGCAHRLEEDSGVGEQGWSARLLVDGDVTGDLLGE